MSDEFGLRSPRNSQTTFSDENNAISIENRGRLGRNIILECLAWRPIRGQPHVCPRNWQHPQLAFVRRALASLHASSCSQDWSWGACPLFRYNPLRPRFPTDMLHYLCQTQYTSVCLLLCFLARRQNYPINTVARIVAIRLRTVIAKSIISPKRKTEKELGGSLAPSGPEPLAKNAPYNIPP